MHPYLTFIRENLPADWAEYPRALLEEFSEHARMLRETVPWCAALSDYDFLHYVLCPRVNDEDLSSHRPLPRPAVAPDKGTSTGAGHPSRQSLVRRGGVL